MHFILRNSLVVGGILSLGLSAQAALVCDSNSSVCFFDNMPLYNQNDETIGKDLLPKASSSMLCGPTSGAMVLQTVVNDVKDPAHLKATSWTQKTFIADTASMSFQARQNAQIRTMAKKMNTSPTVGTYGNYLTQGAATRKADFATGKADGVTTAYPSAFPTASYQGYIRDQKSPVIFMYGYYSRSSKVSNGKTYYSYTRNGGHILALNGYSGENLLIYDPWYAKKVERTIAMVNKGCNGSVCQNLPGNLSQRALIHTSGSSFYFMDMHSRLWLK